MNRASVPGLDALLNRPSAAVLPAPLRQALREHWEAPECDHQMRASWSVLGDTLDALSMLSADEGAVVAALLFDLPGLRGVAHACEGSLRIVLQQLGQSIAVDGGTGCHGVSIAGNKNGGRRACRRGGAQLHQNFTFSARVAERPGAMLA